jgi:hypothetical protein
MQHLQYILIYGTDTLTLFFLEMEV